MFERFKAENKEMETYNENKNHTPAEEVVEQVLSQNPEIIEDGEKQEEKVLPDGPDENKHPVRTVEDVKALRDKAANPHGFQELQ